MLKTRRPIPPPARPAAAGSLPFVTVVEAFLLRALDPPRGSTQPTSRRTTRRSSAEPRPPRRRATPTARRALARAARPRRDAPVRPGGPRANVRAMTWSARKRAWEAHRLADAIGPRAGAQAALQHDQRHPDRAALRSVVVAARAGRQPGRWRRPDPRRPSRRPPPPRARPLGRLRPAPRRRPARRAAVHPRHPPDRLPDPPLDDADVRRLRRRRGHERPVPVAARRRPDRPLDRLRHADAVRLRHRRSRGRGRVRDVRRRASAAWPTWRSCSTACRSTGSRRR